MFHSGTAAVIMTSPAGQHNQPEGRRTPLPVPSARLEGNDWGCFGNASPRESFREAASRHLRKVIELGGEEVPPVGALGPAADISSGPDLGAGTVQNISASVKSGPAKRKRKWSHAQDLRLCRISLKVRPWQEKGRGIPVTEIWDKTVAELRDGEPWKTSFKKFSDTAIKAHFKEILRNRRNSGAARESGGGRSGSGSEGEEAELDEVLGTIVNAIADSKKGVNQRNENTTKNRTLGVGATTCAAGSAHTESSPAPSAGGSAPDMRAGTAGSGGSRAGVESVDTYPPTGAGTSCGADKALFSPTNFGRRLAVPPLGKKLHLDMSVPFVEEVSRNVGATREEVDLVLWRGFRKGQVSEQTAIRIFKSTIEHYLEIRCNTRLLEETRHRNSRVGQESDAHESKGSPGFSRTLFSNLCSQYDADPQHLVKGSDGVSAAKCGAYLDGWQAQRPGISCREGPTDAECQRLTNVLATMLVRGPDYMSSGSSISGPCSRDDGRAAHLSTSSGARALLSSRDEDAITTRMMGSGAHGKSRRESRADTSRSEGEALTRMLERFIAHQEDAVKSREACEEKAAAREDAARAKDRQRREEDYAMDRKNRRDEYEHERQLRADERKANMDEQQRVRDHELKMLELQLKILEQKNLK